MSEANKKVIAALAELGIPCEINLLEYDTRTSFEAAQTLDCSVAQIAKSLIFRTTSQRALLAVTSGANRVDVKRLGDIVGETVLKADADFVRSATRFVIGGVAPVGMPASVATVFDRDLFRHEIVWAAAGTPNSLFPISRKDLFKLAADRIFDFTERLE